MHAFSLMVQVLRNEKGEALAGGGDVLMNILNANRSEALAFKRGLQLVETLGCRPVLVESDSLQLVGAFNGVVEIWSPYTAIVMDCFQIATRIGQVKVQFCPREANMVAHKIAREVYNSNLDLFWDDNPPSFIIPDVLNDVTLFG